MCGLSYDLQSLERLDRLFCKYLYKGRNPFTSKHVKQTPHEPNLMWASNQYLIVFQVRRASFSENQQQLEQNHRTVEPFYSPALYRALVTKRLESKSRLRG